MPQYRPEVRRQLRNITAQTLIRALLRDGWERQTRKGRQGRRGSNTLTFRHPNRPPANNKVVIHPHPKKTMGASLLKEILDCIGWTEEDLKRLKLIK